MLIPAIYINFHWRFGCATPPSPTLEGCPGCRACAWSINIFMSIIHTSCPTSPGSHPQKMAGVGPFSCLPFHKPHSPHPLPHYSYHPNYPYHLVFSSPSDELPPFFIPHVSPNTFLFQRPARSEAILSSLYYISPIFVSAVLNQDLYSVANRSYATHARGVWCRVVRPSSSFHDVSDFFLSHYSNTVRSKIIIVGYTSLHKSSEKSQGCRP